MHVSKVISEYNFHPIEQTVNGDSKHHVSYVKAS